MKSLFSAIMAHIATIRTVLPNIFTNCQNADVLRTFMGRLMDRYESQIEHYASESPERIMEFVRTANETLSSVLQTTILAQDRDWDLLMYLIDCDLEAYRTIMTNTRWIDFPEETTPLCKGARILYNQYKDFSPKRISQAAHVLQKRRMDLFHMFINQSYTNDQATVLFENQAAYDLAVLLHNSPDSNPLGFLSVDYTPEVMDGILRSYPALNRDYPDMDPTTILSKVPSSLTTAKQAHTYALFLAADVDNPDVYITSATPDIVCEDFIRMIKNNKGARDYGLDRVVNRWEGFSPLLATYYKMKYPQAGPNIIWNHWKNDIRRHPHTNPDELGMQLSMLYLQQQNCEIPFS